MQMNPVTPTTIVTSPSRIVDFTWDRRIKRNRRAAVSRPAIHIHKDMMNFSSHADDRYKWYKFNHLWDRNIFSMRANMSSRVNSRHGRDQHINVFPAIVNIRELLLLLLFLWLWRRFSFNVVALYRLFARLSPSWSLDGVNSIVFVHPDRHDRY